MVDWLINVKVQRKNTTSRPYFRTKMNTFFRLEICWFSIYIYMLPYPRRVEFSSEWSNRVAISVYCKSLNTLLLLAPRGWRVRGLDWRLSQLGFDPSYGKLICLATLMSSDRTKEICLWMTTVCEWLQRYILPYPRRGEFSIEWSNRVSISVYCKSLHIWIEVSVAVKRMYVNNSNCDS